MIVKLTPISHLRLVRDFTDCPGPRVFLRAEFEEAADLLSSDPGATTLSVSLSTPVCQQGAALLGGKKASGGFWTFEYYQSFFNVDTLQVLDRVKGSVMPLPGRNFIKHNLRSNPDCPFWICVTLVFTVAISGNLSTFLKEMGNPEYHYTPQFHRVSVAAVMIFLYAWLVPAGLWGFLSWRQGVERQVGGYSFLETVCVYGYSLFIYIPTSVSTTCLAALDVDRRRHGDLGLGAGVDVLAGGSGGHQPMAVATVATIVILHTLLAVGCKVSGRITP
uniref:Protein YIPF n=1 Tax=Neogobius melanostomus TaxID=47308 RepID=A0A8C6WT58_9GOBI